MPQLNVSRPSVSRSFSGAPKDLRMLRSPPSPPKRPNLPQVLRGLAGGRRNEAESATLSVLVFAPTGHGKSTLINSVHQHLEGGDAPNVLIGTGASMGRRTSQSTFADVPARSLRFNKLELSEPSELERQHLLEKQVCDYQRGIDDLLRKNIADLGRKSKEEVDLWLEEQDMGEHLVESLHQHRDAIQKCASSSDYTAEVCPGDDMMMPNTQEPVNLRWIDTPGLDDSYAQDDKILAALLKKLCEWNTGLLATVCVVKHDVPNGNAFFKALQRYWHQFEPFQNNWIFVHTGWDPHSSDDYRGGETFESACALRKAALIVDLARHMGASSSELVNCQHVFIENGGLLTAKRVASRNKPIQELLKMEQAKSINRLLAAVLRNSPVKVRELPFRKSEKILDMDKQLRGIAQGWTIIVAERLTSFQNLLDAETKKLVDLQQVCEVELDTQPTEAVGFWLHRRTETVTLDVTLPRPDMLEHVQVSAIPSHRHWFGSCVHEGVREEKNGSTSKAVWTPTISSPPLMGFKYALKLTAPGEVWNSNAIEELQRNISRLNNTITGLVSARDALNNLKLDINQESIKLQLWCSNYDSFYDWYHGEDGQQADQVTILERYGNAMHLPPGCWCELKSPITEESGGWWYTEESGRAGRTLSTTATASAMCYNIAS